MDSKFLHYTKVLVWTFTAISTGIFLVHAGGKIFALTSGDEPQDSKKFILPEKKPDESLRTVTLGWVGDIAPGTDNRYESIFKQVESELKKPEIMTGNLEGVLSERGTSKCGTGAPLCFAFRGSEEFARILRESGFDLVNLANNHSFDFGNEGYDDTKQALQNTGLPYAGARGEITYLESVEGVQIGFVGFSSYEWTNSILDYTSMRDIISKADEQSDIVIVFFHGGSEGTSKTSTPKDYEYLGNENRGFLQKMAYTAIDSGADLVLGSGPHVLRGMEFYKGKLIAYSLGNFSGINRFKTTGDLGISGILSVTLDESGDFVFGSIIPVQLSKDGIPSLDPSQRAWGQIRDRSFEDFGGSGVRVTEYGMLY